jgi:signal transduction histidine kinase
LNRRKSLSDRLVVLLLITQLGAFIIGWVGGVILGLYGVHNFETSLDEMSYARMRSLLISSLIREGSSIRIDPDTRLQSEMRRTPDMLFAVLDFQNWQPVQGSNAELVEALDKLAPLHPTWLSFSLDAKRVQRPRGFLQKVDLPEGSFVIAVHGARFTLLDLLLNLWSDLQWIYVYLLPIALLSAMVTWFAVRHSLGPLRAVSQAAAGISLSSLSQRLPVVDVPAEIAPLVDSMNDTLARLDKEAARLRRFIANSAHELRTPVAILVARLDAPRRDTFMIDLRRDAQRLKCVVEQLLATVQLESHAGRPRVVLDLVTVTKSLASDATLLAFQSGIDIEFDGPELAVLVKAELFAVNSILSNLIDNALHAEPKGGFVLVRVISNGEVWICDHGPGILISDREKVFEPFWRKDPKTQGMGLGLAIARETMTSLNGKIWIEETPGGGATFKVMFELSDSVAFSS